LAFSQKNAIVLEVLLKDQEAEIIAERRAKTIVAVGKWLGLAPFVMNGREAAQGVGLGLKRYEWRAIAA
jgi:hypothetical protein